MKTAFLLLSLSLTIFLLDSCVEPTEGCLDTFSSNYSLFADTECEDCCTYPNLNFSTKFLYGEDENIDSSLYYRNSTTSYFRLRSFFIVMSEFELHGDVGDYLVRSKIEDKAISDDLLKVEFRRTTNIPGKIRLEDSIRSIDFKLGLPIGLDMPANPDEDYQVIEVLSDSMHYEAGQFYKMLIEIEVDSMPETNITLAFPSLDKQLTDNVVAGTKRGNGMNIQLSVDFMRLFNGIEFQRPDVAEEAKIIILENIADAIEFN